MSSEPDRQKLRSNATQEALMLSAEKLIAKKGIKNVSIKEIVSEAGQKNESALQYHFNSLQGLIDTLHLRRSEQTQSKRAELLEELIATGNEISLRDVCRLMVLPSFLLARKSADHRRYILSFSHETALRSDSLHTIYKAGGGGQSGKQTQELLRENLPHLDDEAFTDRMESAIRLTSISIGHHARQKNAFRGETSDLFLSNLVDTLVGLLGAPVSDETLKLRESQTKR